MSMTWSCLITVSIVLAQYGSQPDYNSLSLIFTSVLYAATSAYMLPKCTHVEAEMVGLSFVRARGELLFFFQHTSVFINVLSMYASVWFLEISPDRRSGFVQLKKFASIWTHLDKFVDGLVFLFVLHF